MFDRLLVAVDGSEYAKRAARVGAELGKLYDADVEIVNVLRDRTRNDVGPDGDPEAASRRILDDAAAATADLDVTVETRSVRGRPAEAIVDRAAAFDADLVAIGRQGRSGLSDRLLGTVTEEVLRRTDAPVLTVPDGELGNETGIEYENVLVTTDGSENAEAAAPYGGDLARRFGATLHLLSVVDVQSDAGVFDAGGVSEEYVEQLEAQAREATERLAAGVDEADGDADIDVRTAVVRGAVHEGVGEYVAENDVDLIVMSSEGQSSLVGQRVGSVTGRVLRTVDVPVFVVIAPE